jgi:hypothetical protein
VGGPTRPLKKTFETEQAGYASAARIAAMLAP